MFKKKKKEDELHEIVLEHRTRQIKLDNYIKEHNIRQNKEEWAVAVRMEKEVDQLARHLVNLNKLIYGKKSIY